MPAHAEGVPCWADVLVPDLAAGKHFYGELFGWTFGESPPEFGYYTGALSDGKAVAALTPPMPDQEPQAAWTLYYASDDTDATAERIRAHGGELLMEPMDVAEFGRMCLARDPGGAVFGVWQARSHTGFDKEGEPGAYTWSEVNTRDAAAVDAFYPAVFPSMRSRPVPDASVDLMAWEVDGAPVAARCLMTDDWPASVPAHIAVYFAVDDCDAALDTVTRLGGQVHFGPLDSPYGRFAGVADQQGAAFSVIDLSKRVGEPPL
ncbi:VOC family protein [Streptomyces sp. JJ66]|uniref:VOC family protein n=1 Tax=Streptomyces sp. JJ66 TaxID=2803843 RepID=UPI001C5A27AB|nr:VOC family protein [Streptomyces sp. JJ66]MBW1604223.1 VOC family protein [Streptomyces sp. JJ66]